VVLSKEILLSDLLRHRVCCDSGIDHGPGLTAWMHPPVHRILGWVTRPSALKLSREVWRLNQLKGFSTSQAFVKGTCSESDQITIDRLPTLLEAELLNYKSEKLGIIADFSFNPFSGVIINYFISRSDPRLPGTSRWRLEINRIIDQQPGVVSTNLKTLDDLPITRSSLRQNLINKSKVFRDQLQDISYRASDRLEGWLEDSNFNPYSSNQSEDYESNLDLNESYNSDNDPLDGWEDNLNSNSKDTRFVDRVKHQDDPWI